MRWGRQENQTSEAGLLLNIFERAKVGAFQLLVIIIVLMSVPFAQAFAQDTTRRPARAAEVVEALDNALWKELEIGATHIGIQTALGVRLEAFRFQPKYFTFSLEQQNISTGEVVQTLGPRVGAFLAVNGGFFAREADGSLRAVGLLKDDGEIVSRPWRTSGGYLVVEENGLSIWPTKKILKEDIKELVQSRPVIIEQGKRWALNNNLGNIKNRSLVCILPDASIIILTISGQGLSLYEAGWTLRGKEWGGWFDCDSAIALDGGGSTQLYVKQHPEFTVVGDTPVHNALVVKRK